LLAADATDEAFEMVDGLTCAPHQIIRRDALTASSALGAEASAGASSQPTERKQCKNISLVTQQYT